VSSALLIGSLIVSAFVGAMLRVSGAFLTPAAVLGLICGGAVITASGLLIVQWSVGDAGAPRLALAILLGSVAASLFLVGACFLTGRRAGALFVAWSVLVAAAAWHAFHRGFSVRVDRGEWVSLVLIGLVVAFWCRRSAALLPTIHATGIAPVWSDYFIHGAQINQFGARLATGRSSFVLSDQPADFYHYAPYMLPAAVSSLVDLPGVAMAASVLFPYGVLLLSFGAYALVRTLTTPQTGLLAALALLILPDASTHGLRNGFFGFHWFLGASPGTGYAIGAAFTALTFIALWRATGRRECLWMGGLLTVAVFQVRAQLFLLFAPALVATLACETCLVRRHARGIAVAVMATFGISLVIVAAITPIRHAWLRFTAFGTFVETMHTAQAPSAYDGVYQSIEHRYGLASAQAAGFAALIPAVLGALTVLAPAAGAVAIRRGGWRSLDSFPLWCLLGWLGLVLIAPASSFGDATAWQYHSFVLVYAAGLVWTLVALHRAMQGTQFERSAYRSSAPGLAVAALCVSALVGRGKDPVKPRTAWGRQLYGTAVDRGLLEAATFVRANAKRGDRFALIPAEPSAFLDDAATRFAALADVPAYLTRPGIFTTNPRLRAVVEQRLTEVQKLESATDPKAAFDLLRQVRVTFLVALGSHVPRFDPDDVHAVFRTHGAAVYYVEP
jgi:hypothetical protein